MTDTTGSPGAPIALPEKPALEGLERKWLARWETERTYAFDRTATRENVYAIDTPPPTSSRIAGPEQNVDGGD